MDSIRKNDEYINITSVSDNVSSQQKNDYNYKILDIRSFLNYELPSISYLFDGFIKHPSSSMIYAEAGVGKTFVALSLALALVSGSDILGYSVSKPRKVLYIDGEMSAIEMQERLEKLIKGMNCNLEKIQENFYLYPYGIQDDTVSLDLGKENTRNYIEINYLENIEVLIIDNLSSLVQLKENENDEWKNFNNWCAHLRKKGISVITIHHVNKQGDSRGAISKRDHLDFEIELRRNKDTICWKYTKHRSLSAEKAQPFSFRIQSNDDNIVLELTNKLSYSQKTSGSNRNYEKEFACLISYLNINQKITYENLEQITGVPHSTLNRMVKKYIQS